MAKRAATVPRPQVRRAAPPAAADLLSALDAIAPLAYAAPWDNVGLLAGRADWPAGRVLLAIDLTDAVAREALACGAQAVVAYHPPIFKGIRAVTPAAEAPTTLLPDLLAARVSILAVHTALDAAPGGTNDLLLDALECGRRWPLEPHRVDAGQYKLVVFVPQAETAALREALSAAGAGVIGHYTQCSFELRGRGTFRGDETTNPTLGTRGRLEYVDEVRLEMVVPRSRLSEVVRALYAAHPYEEPAFDLYPLSELPARARAGMGRVGVLPQPLRGVEIVRRLRRSVDLRLGAFVGDPQRRFGRVIAAAGSFGVASLRDPEALVLTGELKHHDALALLARNVAAVCLGHYASEAPALKYLRRELRRRLPAASVSISRASRPPFSPLAE